MRRSNSHTTTTSSAPARPQRVLKRFRDLPYRVSVPRWLVLGIGIVLFLGVLGVLVFVTQKLYAYELRRLRQPVANPQIVPALLRAELEEITTHARSAPAAPAPTPPPVPPLPEVPAAPATTPPEPALPAPPPVSQDIPLFQDIPPPPSPPAGAPALLPP